MSPEARTLWQKLSLARKARFRVRQAVQAVTLGAWSLAGRCRRLLDPHGEARRDCEFWSSLAERVRLAAVRLERRDR